MIRALGYLGVNAPTLDDWRGYGPGQLGLQLADRGGGTLSFRMDDARQRLVVAESDGPRLAFAGWDVGDAASLDRMAARIDNAGIAVTRGDRALAEQRHVADLVWCLDPFGNRVELFHGQAVAPAPFVPGRTLSGFRTGALGMGHAVLFVPDVQAGLRFYRDLLGFGLSDYADRPFEAYFLHVNQRHHSLALIRNPAGDSTMHHVMMELFSLDDVGQGYDLAIRDGSVAVTLGRHINDHVTGFYTRTPSGFLVEYGWGGRTIDPATWPVQRLDHGYSFWGHERDWLPPEGKAEALALRLDAADRGLRAPVNVMPGNHSVMPGACPWWDDMTRSAA